MLNGLLDIRFCWIHLVLIWTPMRSYRYMISFRTVYYFSFGFFSTPKIVGNIKTFFLSFFSSYLFLSSITIATVEFNTWKTNFYFFFFLFIHNFLLTFLFQVYQIRLIGPQNKIKISGRNKVVYKKIDEEEIEMETVTLWSEIKLKKKKKYFHCATK